MANKLKTTWQSISPQDRKLIKLTAVVCYLILMVSLVSLFMFARTIKPHPQGPDSTATKPTQEQTDSAKTAEGKVGETKPSEEALPPPPPGAQELLAGLDSFDTRAHRELAKIYAERQDFDMSILHAKRIAAQLEEDLEFQGDIGKTYLAAGNPAEAIPHLLKAIKLGNKSAEILADLALAKFRGQNADSGLASIAQAIKQFPDNALLETHETAMYGEAKDKGNGGEAKFRKLVQRFPKFAEAHYQYGRFLMNQGNYASSLKELQTAKILAPLDPRTHARLGMALFQLGRDPEAERSYKTAIAMNPRDYNTWFNLGELKLSQANESDRPSVFTQDTREALEYYLTALANHPDHPQAHYRVGVILNANHQNREAIRHLEVALQAEPHSLRALIQLATAWEALGDKAKAWEYVQQAYEIDPFNKLVADEFKRLKGEPKT